jgi:exportin-1
MIILKLLSQEVFDFSAGEMTQAKIQELKHTFSEQFATIYELCEFVLIRSEKPSLINATLETFHSFLTWIPVGYIFGFNMISVLINKVYNSSIIYHLPSAICLCLSLSLSFALSFVD